MRAVAVEVASGSAAVPSRPSPVGAHGPARRASRRGALVEPVADTAPSSGSSSSPEARGLQLEQRGEVDSS